MGGVAVEPFGRTVARVLATRPLAAERYIRAALIAVLPEGVPPSFSAIHNARFEGSGRRRAATASLTMIDGLSATVRVWQAGPCTAHSYPTMEGGALFYEDGRWQRDLASVTALASVARYRRAAAKVRV